MKTAKPLTDDQAKLIQELGLAAETVTFKKPGVALPCKITIQNEGEPLKRWISRDKASGELKLDDEKPRTGKPLRDDESSDDKAETLDLEKSHGKWRQTGKRALSDCIESSRYNPEKLDADLRQNGFNDLEAKAIVAQVCDGDTIRQAAKKIGKSHGFVGAAKIQRRVKALREGKPLSEASEATGASDAARKAATDAQNRWTLPEAMVKAQQMVAYLAHAASDPGIGAVELGKLLPPGRSFAEEQLTDTELQSWLTNNDQTAEGREKNLLMASARAVEKATGISFKVFVRAWKQEPKLQEMFLHNLHQ